MEQAQRLLNLISSPLASSIYQVHPNDLSLDSEGRKKLQGVSASPDWNAWWQSCGKRDDSWRVLAEISLDVDTANSEAFDIHAESIRNGLPEDLLRLLFDAKTLSLPRHIQHIPMMEHDTPVISCNGMSPKKHHEVSRMTAYVVCLLDTLRSQLDIEVRHIVDIGAGQGYLSRSLCSERNIHVLALDSSPRQTEGSARRYQQSEFKGTLTHRTLWLGDEPTFETHPGLQGSNLENMSFDSTIDDWINSSRSEDGNVITGDASRGPVPVVFIALHACGYLSTSILQKVLHNRRDQAKKDQSWFVAAAVVVGCCYNLMGKDDFPRCRALRNYIEQNIPSFELTSNHLQLAAQVPSQWFKSGVVESATELSMKKVLYRALITPLLVQTFGEERDARPSPQKLGKLNVKAYENFEGYLDRAGRKLGIDLLASYREISTHNLSTIEMTPLARCIKSLHALRCLLGPPVESLIILDRYLWLQEELDRTQTLDVGLVNLFDQEAGSARNVAIVLTPCSSCS